MLTQHLSYYTPSWQLAYEDIDSSYVESSGHISDSFASQYWGKRHIDDALYRAIDDDDGTADGIYERGFAYLLDNQFSVIGMFDLMNGSAHERLRYDAYGQPTHSYPEDLTGDGLLDFFDFSEFTTGLGASDPRADLDFNGLYDFFDTSIFLDGFGNKPAIGSGRISDDSAHGPGNSLGFMGYRWDPEAGLWLGRNRMYSPEAGRWLQRDPAGYVDGLSMYLFVRGNPLSYIDPMGLCAAGRSWFSDFLEITKAFGEGLGEGIGNTVDALIVEPAKGVVSLGGGIVDTIQGEGDTTILGQLIQEAYLEGPVSVGKEIGGQIVDGVVDTAKGMANGEGEAFTNFGSAILPIPATKLAKTKLTKNLTNKSDNVRVSTRLDRDISVNPKPPKPLGLDRPIGTSATQNARMQDDIVRLRKLGYEDFRVNQQQVNASGVRVGINRPDLQATGPRGSREYFEYDRASSNRAAAHLERLKANDPNGVVHLITQD